ncbi:hypothetical protein GMSM_43380 [Geomonas sp. Red276]
MAGLRNAVSFTFDNVVLRCELATFSRLHEREDPISRPWGGFLKIGNYALKYALTFYT